MVLGILSLAATIPLLATSTVGLQQTAEDSKQGNGRSVASTKTSKSHLMVVPSARMSKDVKDILKDRKLILKDGVVKLGPQNDNNPPHHQVTAYFLPFPNQPFDGMVSTIDEMNMLNWVFVDSISYNVTYGTRAQAEKHFVGPMGLTIMADGNSKVTMDGWDGYMAVEDADGEWSLFFDKESNGLDGKLNTVQSRRVAQVELHRQLLE